MSCGGQGKFSGTETQVWQLEDGLVGTEMDHVEGTKQGYKWCMLQLTPIPVLWSVLNQVPSLLPFMLILFDCTYIIDYTLYDWSVLFIF